MTPAHQAALYTIHVLASAVSLIILFSLGAMCLAGLLGRR